MGRRERGAREEAVVKAKTTDLTCLRVCARACVCVCEGVCVGVKERD